MHVSALTLLQQHLLKLFHGFQVQVRIESLASLIKYCVRKNLFFVNRPTR